MDRKEAVLRIKEHMKHHGIGEYPHLKLKEALDMAIAALSQPNEWVSVENAMPPELKMVLVYCGGLYDVAGWVKNEDGEVCWTCKTSPNFWRKIPEME